MKNFIIAIFAVTLASQAFATVGIGVNYVTDFWKADGKQIKQLR